MQATLRTGPFEVTPTFLDLAPMDSFTVSVTFRPTSIHSLISRKLEDAA